MRKLSNLFILTTTLALALCGCEPTSTPYITPAVSSATSVPSAISTTLPTSTPQGKIIIVTSTEDSGPGTLRQGLVDARPGDTINFDKLVFPPDQPNIIYLQSMLKLARGGLTIDADQAGVVLDGSKIPGSGVMMMVIVSNGNTISGLQMRSISGTAIYIPTGQDNVIRDNILGDSDYGIFIEGVGAFDNTITGNHVGVLADGVTPLGIRTAGILVTGGAHDNQIGPNNTIAFSDQCGINFWPPHASQVGNTISQNSIHDNGQRGIALRDSNDSLAAPLLFNFDLDAGALVGAACAQCTVEIFSDNGNQGEIYEGQAVADENGLFTYDNGTAFRGPFLTATATDANGNTSEFSAHTFGLRRSLTLQEENDQLIAPLVTRPYQELADNRMSNFNVLDRWDENGGLVEVEQLGTRWMRLSLDHIEWEPAVRDHWYSQSEITEIQDKAISSLLDNGTTIVYVLVHWDESLHTERAPDYGNAEEVQLFLDYTRMIVSHFKGRIPYYEILNEPLAYVEVEDYLNLIHRMIPVIYEADPQAKIVVGGATALSEEWSRDYLFDVLQSDVMPLVDAINIHPFYGESPQYDETSQYYYDYPILIQEIKDTATAHGFRGDYFAEEMGWDTPVDDGYEPWIYSDTVSAKYYARAIVMNLGMELLAESAERL